MCRICPSRDGVGYPLSILHRFPFISVIKENKIWRKWVGHSNSVVEGRKVREEHHKERTEGNGEMWWGLKMSPSSLVWSYIYKREGRGAGGCLGSKGKKSGKKSRQTLRYLFVYALCFGRRFLSLMLLWCQASQLQIVLGLNPVQK